MKIKLVWLHSYYIDAPANIEDFKLEKINTEDPTDIMYITRTYRDCQNKANFYVGDNKEFKEWINKIK